ncbi:hypothetical protein H7X66_11260 [Dysgonomonas sp. BGC7]|nr:hypothetical protein [Dysgonomonas sp. BGC7]
MDIANKTWTCISNNPVKSIILVGVLVRLLVAVLYQHITLYPDSDGYIFLADKLLTLDLSGYEGQRSPGYPLLLIIGNSVFGAVFIQAVIGICTTIVFYRTLLLLNIKDKPALIISLILTCYLPVIFFEMAILTESVTLFVITSIFYVYFNIIFKEERRLSFFWLVLLSLYLVLIKPFYIFLPILLFFFLSFRKMVDKGHIGKYLLLLLLPLITYLGWSYVNKLNTGYFVPTTYYGFNLAQNCVSFAENTSVEYREIGEVYAKYRDNRISDKEEAMVIWEACPEMEAKTGLSFSDLSNLLYDYSVTTIKMNPLAYLKQVSVSWMDFWKTSFYWEPYSFGVPQANEFIGYIAFAERILLQLVKALFVLLIPYNIICDLRKWRFSPQLIISVVVLSASILQALMTYGTNSRFSFPFELLIIVSVVLNMRQYINKEKPHVE